MLATLMNIGNILFTIGTLPQCYKIYRNRKNLKDISLKGYLLFSTATICFTLAGMLANAWATVLTTIAQNIFNVLTVYWLWRYK